MEVLPVLGCSPPPPENSLFSFKVSPIQELGGFFVQLPTEGAHILTLTSWLPKLSCRLSGCSASLLPLCVLQVRALRDAAPFPTLIRRWRALGTLGDAQASNSGTSAPASHSSLGSILLVAAPAWAQDRALLPHFQSGPCHPLPTPPPYSLLPVIQAPACLPRQPPASPPSVFPSLCEGHVDALSHRYMLLSPKLLHASQQHRRWVLSGQTRREGERQLWSLFPGQEVLGGRAQVPELLGAPCPQQKRRW